MLNVVCFVDCFCHCLVACFERTSHASFVSSFHNMECLAGRFLAFVTTLFVSYRCRHSGGSCFGGQPHEYDWALECDAVKEDICLGHLDTWRIASALTCVLFTYAF